MHALGVVGVLLGGLHTARPAGLALDFDAAAGDGGAGCGDGPLGPLLTVEALHGELLRPALQFGASDAVRCTAGSAAAPVSADSSARSMIETTSIAQQMCPISVLDVILNGHLQVLES